MPSTASRRRWTWSAASIDLIRCSRRSLEKTTRRTVARRAYPPSYPSDVHRERRSAVEHALPAAQRGRVHRVLATQVAAAAAGGIRHAGAPRACDPCCLSLKLFAADLCVEVAAAVHVVGHRAGDGAVARGLGVRRVQPRVEGLRDRARCHGIRLRGRRDRGRLPERHHVAAAECGARERGDEGETNECDGTRNGHTLLGGPG
jgi:hypothetical protein